MDIAALGALGAGLAAVVLGSKVRWAAVLLVGGMIVTVIGAWIYIA